MLKKIVLDNKKRDKDKTEKKDEIRARVSQSDGEEK